VTREGRGERDEEKNNKIEGRKKGKENIRKCSGA
jgi:hypothetical protein